MECVTCSSSGRLEFSSHDQANIVPLSVDYDVYISHAIENNLHKQQCIIGLPRTRKYNALLNIIHIVCLQALMNVGYIVCSMHTPYKLGDLAWLQ